MATVAEARTALNAMMNYGSGNFSNAERDFAIRYALERAAKKTGMLRTIGSITVIANDRIITHSLTRFLPARRYAACYTSSADGFRRVTSRDLADVQAALDLSTTTGRPEMISFYAKNKCMIYPISDGSYTIEVPYEQTAPTWTFGSGDATDLEFEDSMIYGGILWGAKHYLLSGITDAQAEANQALAMFERFLRENEDANIDLAPTTNPYYATFGQSHTPSP